VRALAERLAGRCDLRLGEVVRSVQWEAGDVRLDCSGGSLRARAAVITVPLLLLQPSSDEPGGVTFVPRLEAKAEAAGLLRMGPVVKVVLAFRRAFWNDVPELSDVLFVHAYGRPIPTWWMPVDRSLPLLTGWAGGPHAARLAGESRDTVVRLAVGSLADALGMRPGDVEALHVSAHFHDWSADPYARGGYTYVRAGGAEAHRVLAEPVAGTLFFAGEATCGGGYNATMEGALRSGRRAAAELLGT
jgi:monoamine oxidase